VAIYIRIPEVERAVRDLAAQMGVDLTQAIGSAVRHALVRLDMAQSDRLTKMRAIADQVSRLPIRDARSADKILGYDGTGLPQ
jgi:hypothetical protein